MKQGIYWHGKQQTFSPNFFGGQIELWLVASEDICDVSLRDGPNGYPTLFLNQDSSSKSKTEYINNHKPILGFLQ